MDNHLLRKEGAMQVALSFTSRRVATHAEENVSVHIQVILTK